MALVGALSVWCEHCHGVDALPADELSRVLELKNRLALAEQGSLQVRGVDATLAGIFEDRSAFLRVAGLYLGVALLVLGSTVAGLVTLPNVEKMSPEVVIEVLSVQATAPALVLGLALSVALAFAYGRRHYRKSLRPLLLARVPVQAGALFRCRVCGGDLPPARGAEARCGYCRSVNIVPKALHGAQLTALADETELQRKKLSSANSATMSIARRMRHALLLLVGLSLAFAWSLPLVSRALLTAVFLR